MTKTTQLVKRIWNIIPKEYRKKALFFLLSSIVLLVLDILSIFLLIPLIITLLKPSSELNFLSSFIIKENKPAFGIVIILFFFAKNYLAIILNKKQANTVFDLSSIYSLKLAKNFILGNYLAFKKQKKSTIVKNIIFVANDFVGNVLLSLNTIICELLLLSAIFIVGLFYYPIATSILVVVLSIILLTNRYYNKKSLIKLNKIRSHNYDENISNLTNLLNGYLSIKSPQLIHQFLEKFKNSNHNLNKNYASLHAKRVNVSKQTEILIVFMLCALYIYIQYFQLETTNIIVFLSLFSALLFKAIPSINKLNISFTNFNSHLYSLDILEEKINSSTPINLEEKITFKKQIILKEISFSFEEGKPLFHNFNLEINKGSFNAIIGKSGVGKTTLLNIIAKLINPNSGTISIDAIKINDLNKYNYFSLITYLTQKPFIYEGTILDNLVLTNTNYDLNFIHDVLDKLDILKTIEKLPDGLKTFIGTDGNNLSGGQLQRICIARAIINKSEILILDEATNNLDKPSEEKTLRYLHEYTKKNDITTILISHDITRTKDLFNLIVNLETNEI